MDIQSTIGCEVGAALLAKCSGRSRTLRCGAVADLGEHRGTG